MFDKIKKCFGIKRYFLILATVLVVIVIFRNPVIRGEWDDYTLPVASILSEHPHFVIYEEDVMRYKQLFPVWANRIDRHRLSGFQTQDGGYLTWYFPVYAMVSIPLVLVLYFLGLTTEYAFHLTNIALFVLSLMFCHKYLHVDERKRNLLAFLLGCNPILFYIFWPSGEIFIYSLIICGLTCWYNRWDKRAAIFISIAGMLNPVILSIGIIMIIDYFVRFFKQKKDDLTLLTFAKTNFMKISAYASCYILGLIPLLYNYINTGHIKFDRWKVS